MRRLLARRFAAVFAVASVLALTGGSSALATNSSSCTFEKGTTVCTTTHGSHGSTDSHHGNVGSSGEDLGGGPCKVTGPDHTC
jgi:hypothetical protein